MTTLTQALREELIEYGELLALLQERPETASESANTGWWRTLPGGPAQMTRIQTARRHREQCQQAAAIYFRQPIHSSLWAMRPHVPVEYVPMLEALLREIAAIRIRICRHARQAAFTSGCATKPIAAVL